MDREEFDEVWNLIIQPKWKLSDAEYAICWKRARHLKAEAFMRAAEDVLAAHEGRFRPNVQLFVTKAEGYDGGVQAGYVGPRMRGHLARNEIADVSLRYMNAMMATSSPQAQLNAMDRYWADRVEIKWPMTEAETAQFGEQRSEMIDRIG